MVTKLAAILVCGTILVCGWNLLYLEINGINELQQILSGKIAFKLIST